MISVTKKTRQIVCNRDGGRCVLCKRDSNLHLHHIHGRSRLKTNDIDNCIMLCADCHRMVHGNQKKWQPKLEEIIDGYHRNGQDSN